MTIVSRRPGSRAALRAAAACAAFCSAFCPLPAAHAQDSSTNVQTPLDRQLAKIDFAVTGSGQFSTNTNGSNYLQQNVSLSPSNTLGAVVTLRYIKSPYIGLEGNYGYARYTENFTLTNTAASPAGVAPLAIGIQTNASEYTFGYVAHTRAQHFGVLPFASIGLGTIAFKPTGIGGLGFLEQARAGYYYSVGADSPLYASHFGLRVSFRQLIYLAPDYETNYLRELKRSIASEPTLGFFIRF